MVVFETSKEEDLKNIIEYISKFQNCIFLLRGTLASGKTTLVKWYVKYKNIDVKVTSPTFLQMHSYEDLVFHYNVYNKDFKLFLAQGLLEYLKEDGVHFIEWGDDHIKDILLKLGFDVVLIDIEVRGDFRKYTIDPKVQ